MIPVLAVIAIIALLYIQYVLIHLARLMQLDLVPAARKTENVTAALWQGVLFHVFTFGLMYCMGRTILTHPGTIPEGSGWDLANSSSRNDRTDGSEVGVRLETKTSGERRYCKWCLKYKPDRCHHCRVCNLCILRMDHHCPWVYNCIGFGNHKYFVLLLIYAELNLLLVNITMFDTVWWSTRVDVPVFTMCFVTAGAALGAVLLVLTSAFLGFHMYLIVRALTTVEFCEKSTRREHQVASVYSRGVYQNICAVLGPVPSLWLLPVSFPVGDGMTWAEFPGRGTSVEDSTDRKSVV